MALKLITGENKTRHNCCICGKWGYWNKNWAWYGSELSLEERKIDKVCSEACREEYNKQNRVPFVNRTPAK